MGPLQIIGYLIFGLIVGALARLFKPGRDPMGWIATMTLGVVGSFVGGGLAYILRLGTHPYAPAGWIFSILGAMLTLVIFYSFSGVRRS